MASKGKKPKARLPRHDRSRALPVRAGWGLWKTLIFAVAVAVAVWVIDGPKTADVPSAPAQVVTPQ